MEIWNNLLGDPLVELQALAFDKGFQAYVYGLVEVKPTAEVLDFDALVNLQYQAIERLNSPSIKSNSGIRRLSRLLSNVSEFKLILSTMGISEQQYYKKCGMTTEEVILMLQRKISTYQFLIKRPGVILAPLLRQLVKCH